MVLNDFRADIKELIPGMQSQVAYGMGLSRQLFDGYVKWATITKGYTELCEDLGYDLEVKYIVSSEGGRMLNDFEEDTKELLLRRGGKKKFLTESGYTWNTVRSRAKHATLSRGMRDILRYLGYDAEVRYVKR